MRVIVCRCINIQCRLFFHTLTGQLLVCVQHELLGIFFVSKTIRAGMALFLLGVCSARFFANLLGKDSFGTFSLKYGSTEALSVFPVELKNEKSERKGVLYVCLCVHCSGVYASH